MNYIGTIFSFMLPGAVVGFMIAALVWETKERRRSKKRHARCHRPVRNWNELYVGE